MCAVNPFMGMINSGMSNGLNAIASNPAMMVPLCALLAGMIYRHGRSFQQGSLCIRNT